MAKYDQSLPVTAADASSSRNRGRGDHLRRIAQRHLLHPAKRRRVPQTKNPANALASPPPLQRVDRGQRHALKTQTTNSKSLQTCKRRHMIIQYMNMGEK